MKRCDQCEFWIAGEAWGGTQPTHATFPDDYHGTCHRHAPQPTKGDFEHYVLQALVLIVQDDGDSDLHKSLYESWEECIEAAPAIWPTTSATQWCGDWERRQ